MNAVATSDEPQTVALRADDVELKIDDIVDGRYRIQRRLGRGGMGTVYESQQIKLQRQVALKVLHPEFAKKELASKRFEREAKAASSIDHRNVVKILDFGHLQSGELYYTMELLEGRDLSQELREKGRVPWARAGWLTLQVARALDAIHDKGIVHRDIKPANCFLLDPKPGDDPDFVKILDFGIANLQDQDHAPALTSTSDIIGSVRYMSPEQAAAEHVDARTDIYSLGIMMYELLTGKVPFRETSLFKVMLQHKYELPRPPRELAPEIPPEVEAIILRAVAKAPEDRFQSMKELEAELLQAIGADAALGSSESSLAPLAPPPPRPRRGRRRLPLGLALGLGTLGATWWLGVAGRTADMSVHTPAPVDAAVKIDAPAKPTAPAESMMLSPLPPDEQYDLFVDPFGGRTMSHLQPQPDGAEGLTDAALLEELLPAAPWKLEPGSILGRLVDERGHAPAKGQVCAWLVDSSAPIELRRTPQCTHVRARGHFELPKVKPGYYEVVAFAPGFVPQSLLERDETVLTIHPGSQSEALHVVLVRGGVEVKGTVTRASAEPIKSAKVAILGPVRALAETNAEGEFSLWMPEDVTGVGLVAWATGYSDVIVRSVEEGRVLDIVLPLQSVLDGKVVYPVSGLPVAGARVRAGTQGQGTNPLVYTEADGSFRITGLSEGLYRPWAHAEGASGRAREGVAVPRGSVSATVVIELASLVPAVGAPPPAPFRQPLPPAAEPTTTAPRASENADDDEPREETGQEEPPHVSAPRKIQTPSERSRRAKLERSLRKCTAPGTTGTITIAAKYVLDTGALFQPQARVAGAAATDPKIQACAENLAKDLRLTRRKSPSVFAPVKVTL